MVKGDEEANRAEQEKTNAEGVGGYLDGEEGARLCGDDTPAEH